MPIEVVIKDEEIAIYIDRKRLLGWIRDVPGALDGESPVPWEGNDPDTGSPEERERKAAASGDSTNDKEDSGSTTDASEPEGYKNAEGDKKEFPNPVETGYTSEEPVDGINLFDEGPTGQKGTLQDAPKGKDKLKAMRDWMKEESFNYRNFCEFLLSLKEVAGFKLSTPVIGVTKQKKEPTLLQVAFRYYSYWLSAKDDIAKQYKDFLIGQLKDIGVTIKMVEEKLDGEEIDPRNLPKGIEVSV